MVGQVLWVPYFFGTRPTSCNTRMRVFALFALMEHDVLFLSRFVISLTLRFIEDGSSCAIHSFTFSEIVFFLQRSGLPFHLCRLFLLRRTVLCLRQPKRSWSSQWVLIKYLSGISDGTSPWLFVPSAGKVSRLVDCTGDVCCFEVNLRYIIACNSRRLRNSFCPKKKSVT